MLPSTDVTFPSSASSCSLTIESSGEWRIEGANDWCVVSPAEGESGDEIVISVTDNELYEERSVELVVSSDGVSATISVNQDMKVETDYIDMGFDKAGTTTNYDIASGVLTVTYSDGAVPTVEVGSAIVLPADYMFDIRVVESVTQSDNSLTVETTKGNMGNLFRNTSFTLSTNGDTRASGVDGRPIIAPIAVGYLNESGEYVEVYNQYQQMTFADYSVDMTLWSFDMNFNGATLYNGAGGRLWWEKCAFDAGLNGVFDFTFGETSGNSPSGKVGDLEYFAYRLNGSLDADLLMCYCYENSATFSDDRILKYNVLPTKVYTFVVGGVTVHLLIYTHIGQYVEFGAEGRVDISGGGNIGLELNAGLAWSKGSGVEPIVGATPHLTTYHPIIEAEASAYAKFSYYPQVEVGLYGFIGPWLEPRPYIKEEVSAGFRVSTDGENYVAFKDEYFSGLDMRMGLKLDFGFWDKDVWESDVFNVVDDTLLITSPARISLVSPQSGMRLEDDDSVDVKFKVESYSPITGNYVTCANAAVVFDSESGELSDYVVLSDASGMVEVNWNPTATRAATKEHTLRATLYDCDGSVIDEVTFVVETEAESCDDANHPHAVDLGLSVKWACCNVGASSPEEYGDYFAWGETSTKSSFTNENYQHWTDYNGDGRCDEDEMTLLSDISGTQYDAARANWGGRWRMPRRAEIEELLEECYWTWTSINGHDGCRVTGPNGNSIFLPAAGYRLWWSSDLVGSYGFYWSSTPYEGSAWDVYDLYFFIGHYFRDWDLNGRGFSVRPVID